MTNAIKPTAETLANPARLRAMLMHELVEYDQKEEAKEIKARRPTNVYRLSIITGRLDEALSEHASGTSLARALYDGFNDRLLTRLEKACGLPVTFGGGAHDTGRPA